jgi:hypothetical protein
MIVNISGSGLFSIRFRSYGAVRNFWRSALKMLLLRSLTLCFLLNAGVLAPF